MTRVGFLSNLTSRKEEKQMKTLMPNLVSFARVPAGFAVAYYAVHNNWDNALVWALFGALTDYFDGEVARWLNAKSDWGKRWVDPICDFLFALGVLYGFSFYSEPYGHRLAIALSLIGLTVFLKVVKEKAPRSKFQAFAYGFLPLVYCACAVIFTYFYLHKALSGETMAFINWTAPVITAVAIATKRHRFKDWIWQTET